MNQNERIALERLLDRGEWKHTWHLPKNQYGYIDYTNPETIKVVFDQIENARNSAVVLNNLADEAERIMKEEKGAAA